ncbi:MAG: hypothetical protein J7484_09295 [Microbacterium sp.]|nr:hypothetical protein [Microbacterium sp.]
MILPPPTAGHVARFVEPGATAAPPTRLPVIPSLRRGGAITIGLLLTLAAVVCAVLIVTLWTEPTPGWWFSALFSVMIAGLLLAAWAAFIAALRDGGARTIAREQWERAKTTPVATAGLITARQVSTLEDGTVDAFEITVALDDGGYVRSVWHRPSARARGILQPQVPVVGGHVRVWRMPGAPAEWPHVVDVTDPSAPRH